ncbi:hypothetical protein PMPD1_0722 [Paramixta manurensis]|uniref:Type VI secretion system-associated protein n=1 Tax=Paramixta manurensis TaxID=2740817 RepID=A0A6M8U869_9GAMM|nr:hypothetical protein PMPD1_0722 [Erwiniaceae bacterium PD-1]
MKYWLTGALTLLVATSAWAEDYNIVSSRTLKLDLYIDNIKDNKPASWCARELPLRIVAKGDKNPTILKDFLPRVGSLLANQCGKLNTIQWQMNDSAGQKLAHGSATKAKNWAVTIEPEVAQSAPATQAPENTSSPTQPPTPPVVRAEDLSPAADTTPWIQFSLLDGCHFRTYWRDDSQAGALFVPAKGGVTCASDGWLNGKSQLTQMGQGAAKKLSVTFLQGFPVSDFANNDDSNSLQITTVNNQRMVLSDERSPQSWMILPYTARVNGWLNNGTVAVQMAQNEANDEGALKARLEEVRKVWAPYLANGGSLTILLVDALHPQLKDPAAGTWRTIK